MRAKGAAVHAADRVRGVILEAVAEKLDCPVHELVARNRRLGVQDAQGKSYYNPKETELSLLLNAFNSIPSVENMRGNDHARWFTYSPNHISAALPDRTIDYLFYSSDLTLVKGKVRSHDTPLISDHLPVIGMFTLP